MSAVLAIPGDNVKHETHVLEERLFVLDGSLVCPSPLKCDRIIGESQDGYVRRHCRDHHLGEFVKLEDAERNLFMACFYYATKYGLGQKTIGPFPFWEHCVFMVEWSFNADDLEQGHPRDGRTWRLPDYDHMRPERVTKRFKKIEKPRGTLKTTIGRAYVTWRILRAYFVENNPNFRVLVISAASRLGRAQWFKMLKSQWRTNANLIRLFGAWEFTCDNCGKRQNVPQRLRPGVDDCPNCRAEHHKFKRCQGCDEAAWHKNEVEHCAVCRETKLGCNAAPRLGDRVRVRQIGIVTKGSFGLDSIQMRWTVVRPDGTQAEEASENFQFGGIDTELAGQRFNLVMADDLNTDKNSFKLDLRESVENAFAEVTNQMTRGQFILSCTRYHLDDLAGQIERKNGPYYEQFHILSRRASWLDKKTGETIYYNAVDELGEPRLDEKFLAEERARKSERGFYSQYMNEPQDPTKSSFKEAWFEPVDDAQVPAPVLWGLGRDYTEEEQKRMREEGIVVDSFLYVDPAGHEEQKARNDRTAMFGGKIYQGIAYVCLLRSMQGSDAKEKDEIYDAAMYLKPRRIRYERKVNERSGSLENGFGNYCRDKSRELSEALKRPVTVAMPMDFVPPSTIVSKRDKIEKTEPLWRSGRVKILKSADPSGVELARCRDEYVGLGITTHDDYPDAGSALQEDLIVPTYALVEAAKAAAPSAHVNERGNIEVSAGEMFHAMLAQKRAGGAGVRRGFGDRRVGRR